MLTAKIRIQTVWIEGIWVKTEENRKKNVWTEETWIQTVLTEENWIQKRWS